MRNRRGSRGAPGMKAQVINRHEGIGKRTGGKEMSKTKWISTRTRVFFWRTLPFLKDKTPIHATRHAALRARADLTLSNGHLHVGGIYQRGT